MKQLKRVMNTGEAFKLVQVNYMPINDNTHDLLFTNDMALSNTDVNKTSIYKITLQK